MDLNDAGIHFIQNFLKFNEILSDTKIQSEDIPHVSVVSPTFFILKLNKNVAQLPSHNRFQISLYMDDLQISYRHTDWRIVERRLQDSIHIVEKYAQKNGFTFSTSKTSMLHFTKLSNPPPIELRLSNIIIEKSETVKQLVLVFDSKLDWKAHIKQLKPKCNKDLNLMRSVTSTE